MILSFAEQDEILDHCFVERPQEACGLILERSGWRRLLRARNVQGLLRVLDPALPSAREAYTLDPTTLLEAAALLRQGWAVSVIYHSHTNGHSGLSDQDRALAAPGGRSLYPDVAYLVVSIQPTRPKPRIIYAMSAWRWSDGKFRKEPINLIGEAP